MGPLYAIAEMKEWIHRYWLFYFFSVVFLFWFDALTNELPTRSDIMFNMALMTAYIVVFVEPRRR